MTSQNLRRTNLRKLVAEFKTATALAEAASTNEKYISQILGSTRNLGHQLARRFENAAGKEPGWMDYDHDNGGLVVTRTDMTPDESELLRRPLCRNPEPGLRESLKKKASRP